VRARSVLLITACIVWVLDRVAKQWALHALTGGRSVHLVGDILQLRLTENSGAAFSLGTGSTWIFTLTAAIVIVVILRMAPRITHTAWRVGLGGLMGGAAGNLADRLVRPPGVGVGHVVDFIAAPNFPVFNVADMAIVGSVALMFLLSARGTAMSEHE